ncbi:hypothetical protein BJV78DRAFT_1277862 [Lactifluus subvellereus]|nr:hypothetical protein BJV78DRAFT_1277862 [Lactifluus subvellereus]
MCTCCYSHCHPSYTELSRVEPLHYVCSLTATIVASLIIFQGLNTGNPVNTQSLIVGFITTFISMHLLKLSHRPAVTGHRVLGNGILNPRFLVQCRSSIDSWPATSSPGLNFGHARHSSHIPLFDAFEDPLNGSAHALGLRSLRKEDGEG